MVIPTRQAFPVINRMVKVGSQLYPVAHSFLVKHVEGSAVDDWLDNSQGEILEPTQHETEVLL